MPPAFDEDDFEAQHDVRVLDEAQQIKSSPQRLARAQRKAKEQMEAAARVANVDMAGADDMLRKGFRKLS